MASPMKAQMAILDSTKHRQGRRVTFTVAFKAIFGFAIAAVLLVGTGYAIFRADFPLVGQLLVACAGAIAGALSAWLFGRPTS
jgi:hypothetical protein